MTITVPDWLAEYLREWENTAAQAPANEVESIKGWLKTLSREGAEETIKIMRRRLLILSQLEKSKS